MRHFRHAITRYLLAVVAVALAFGLRLLLAPITGPGASFALFFAAVLLTSVVAGVGPGLCAVAFSIPVAAVFVLGAGHSILKAAVQAALFAVDGLVVVFITHTVSKARRALEATNQQLQRANDQIAQTAARTQEIVELSPDAFLLADLDARIIDVNAAACAMLGYARDELLGKTLFDLVRPEEAPQLERLKDELTTTRKTYRGEWVQRRKGGAEGVVEVVANILPGGRWQAFARDITERKRLEDELRAAEERFRLAIDDAPIGMTISALDGHFLRVNNAFCEILRYPPAELLGMNFRSITHPDDVDVDVALAGRLARGEIPRYVLEKRYLRKDGSPVDVMLHRSLVRGRDGAPLYYIAQIEDITERKRAERISQQLATIVRHSNDAITTQDLSGNILTWNGCAERMYGYTEAEALEMNIAAIVPEGNTDTLAYLDAVRRGEEAPSVEVKRRAKDGRILDVWLTTAPLFDEGRPVAVATTERDITERKERERERQHHLDAMERLYQVSSLFLSEQPPQAILQEILDTAIAICHADFGNIQILDPAASSLEVVAHRNLPEWWLAFWAGVLKGHGVCGTALAAGERVVVEDVTQSPIFVGTEALDMQLRAGIRAVQSTPLVSRAGAPLGMISTHWKTPHRMAEQTLRLLDLLARRAAEILERVQMEAALRAAVQARDQVLGVVAHDLRNPLTLITIQAKAMRRIGPEPERRNQRPAEVIARAAMRMNRLIQDLLDVARSEAGTLPVERARLSPAALAAEALDTQLPLAVSGSIDLGLELPRELPAVWADRERLLQVFENLIGNALKFTRAGGQIRVGAEPRDSEVVFWVKDTGAGIAAEDLPHVFDRFWQAGTKSGRLGAGLGLAITKGIVEAHGGRIWVESSEGQGTRFYFSVPVERPQQDSPGPLMH